MNAIGVIANGSPRRAASVTDLHVSYLRSFQVVAEELNVTRAAGRLHLAQQALSARIRHLERALGVELLVRTSRGVLLTPAGRELATGTGSVIAGLDRLVARVRAVDDGGTGHLRLVCAPFATTEFAIEAADALEVSVPGVEVELVTVSTPPEVLAPLASGDADVAFLWVPLGVDGPRVAVVRTDPRMVAVPAGHRLADRTSVTLADLNDEPVVVPDVVVSEDAMARWLTEARPDVRPAVPRPSARRIEDRLTLVARGRGVWLAPEPLSRYFAIPRIRWIPVTDAAPAHLAAVWPRTTPESLVAALVTEVRRITGWTGQNIAPLARTV